MQYLFHWSIPYTLIMAEQPGGQQETQSENSPQKTIVLQNIVATVTLGVEIELDKVAQQVSNAEYSPRRFSAVIMRIREPRATALIFRTGKMIVTGTKKEEDSQTAAKKFVKILERVGFAATYSDFKIQNISGTVDLGFPIRLEGLMYAHPNCSTYEPELFPGLVYRLAEPKIVLLIFVSGKIVITGAKNSDMMKNGLIKVYPLLLPFRKSSVILNV